jgi:PAT family beta-lactamase induction signal transducer AmpG
VAALYFAQGLPFGVVNNLFPVYFRFAGMGPADITNLIGTAGYAWALKVLWAPLVDAVGGRKGWILATQLLLAIAFAAVAIPSGAELGPALWTIVVVIAVLSATQDIAIDAYSIEALERREYGAANGMRVGAYRAAMIVGGGLLVALAGSLGWPPVLVAAGGAMLLAAGVTALLPSVRHARPAGGVAAALRRSVVEPLRSFAALPGFVPMLLFVLFFKLGDLALVPAAPIFWVDRGFGTEQIGAAVGTVGMIATIVGAIVGGALTTRWGTFRALWVLGLVQAASNLAYWAAAGMEPSLPVLYGTVTIEQFTSGLGTAAFLAFMMTMCERRLAATQYALLSALFRVSGQTATKYSGALIEWMGYGDYFLLTFALAFPAFLLLPLVRKAVAARERG